MLKDRHQPECELLVKMIPAVPEADKVDNQDPGVLVAVAGVDQGFEVHVQGVLWVVLVVHCRRHALVQLLADDLNGS